MAHRLRGRISYLKRRYGFDRTLLDGLPGAQTWCGLGVLAHNTVKIAHLIEAPQQTHPAHTVPPGGGARAARAPDRNATATGPPPDPPTSRAAAA